MKREIVLQFPTAEALWLFWNELSYNPSHVSLQTKTISYRLTDEEVHLAISKYNAQVIDYPEIQQHKDQQL
jgi:hypothetical protein